MKFRNFILKSVPYVLSIVGGVAVYIVSVDIISDKNMNDMLINVAASLLAIPLIFVLYEYVNYKMSSNLNEKMAESLIFDVNAIVLKMLKVLRRMMGVKQALDWEIIKKMLHMSAKEIKAKQKITSQDIELLKSAKKELNELAYKLLRSGVLSEIQVQSVISITKEVAHVVNEWEYKGNTARLSKYMENLLDRIEGWFDSCERESLQSHQQFQLTIEQETEARTK